MRKLLPACGLALALLSLQTLAWAAKEKKPDPNIRSVQGVVTDPAGSLVSGAIVHLKDTKTLQIRSFITRNDGSYSFHGLSTNVDYELKAEHQGLTSDPRTLSVFDSRSKAVINLKLNKK
jgi:hypothetical protein